MPEWDEWPPDVDLPPREANDVTIAIGEVSTVPDAFMLCRSLNVRLRTTHGIEVHALPDGDGDGSDQWITTLSASGARELAALLTQAADLWAIRVQEEIDATQE